MKGAFFLFAGAVVSWAAPVGAQTIPEGSQASKVQSAYRRTPSFRVDPFRHVQIPHWGFVTSVGLTGGNNTLNTSDMGALLLLRCGGVGFSCDGPDSLTVSSMIDAIGLIPRGTGITGFAQGEGGAYLGGPFGGHLSFGLQARGSGYGAFRLDDAVTSLLRDGNSGRTSFSLGSTGAIALATAEAGAHAIIRVGPMGSVDGVKVSLGGGARYLRPAAFVRTRSLLNGGTIVVSGDTIQANVAIEQSITRDPVATLKGKNSWATDFLLRLEWPTSGLALEAMVANIGSINVPHVEVSTAALNINSTNLEDVKSAIDSLGFIIQNADTTVSLTLPRVVRFTASAWANRILQMDLSTTLPVTGDFESPLAVDMVTTWRFIRTLPLRAGMSIGGTEGFGLSGGVAVEGRTMFLQIAGQSLGGLFKNAKGIGVRLEFGLFF